MAKDDSEGVPSERAERIARRQAADRLRGEERRRWEAIAKQQAEKEASESGKCQPGQQLQAGSPAQATDKPPLRRLETAYRPPTTEPNLDLIAGTAFFGGLPLAAYLLGNKDVWRYADWALFGGVLSLACVLYGVAALSDRIFEWWEYRTGKCWDERAIVYCAACNLERVQILVGVRNEQETSLGVRCESGIIEGHWIRGCGQTENMTLSTRERLPDSARKLWRSGAKGLLSGGNQNP